MKRRMWLQVGLVTATLMGASFLNRPTLIKATDTLTAVGNVVVAAISKVGKVGLAAGLPKTALIVGGGALLAVLLSIGVVTWVRRRRRADRHRAPWRQVLTLAQGGRAVSTIARETRMSQDAVRILLAPVPVERTFDPGTSFRAAAAEGGIPPGRRPKRPE